MSSEATFSFVTHYRNSKLVFDFWYPAITLYMQQMQDTHMAGVNLRVPKSINIYINHLYEWMGNTEACLW